MATLAKLLPLGAFVALAALAFQLDTFRLDFSGLGAGRAGMGAGQKHHADHPVGVYRRGGAVVVSARARHKRDVGRATLLAVLSALAVYLLVTLLSLGVVPRSELGRNAQPVDGGTDGQADGVMGRSSLPPG